MRAHLRGLFILLHLIAVLGMALPGPVAGVKSTIMETETGREQVAAWAGLFRAVGINMTDQEAAVWLWDAGQVLVSARSAITTPFAKYYRWCGTRQSWRMFAFVVKRPTLFTVEVEQNGQWQPLYQVGSETATWRQPFFHHERIRGLIAGFDTSKRGYAPFSDWLAAQIHQEFPDATAARTRVLRTPTTLPGQKPAEPRWEMEKEHRW